MKRIKFLIKLKGEEKLELVDPSKEVSESYLQKSESHFESGKILLNADKLEESVSMFYYAMYHCLLALLFKCGIKSENHSGSILLLKELFNEENLFNKISFGKQERIDKQYYVSFRIVKQDCEKMMKNTEKFILNCKTLIGELNQAKIDKIRDELKNALSG